MTPWGYEGRASGTRFRYRRATVTPTDRTGMRIQIDLKRDAIPQVVLNKLFMAVHIISVRRAFCLLCKDLAEVVSLEDGQFATYDFNTWREVSEYRARFYRQEDDDWIRTVKSGSCTR